MKSINDMRRPEDSQLGNLSAWLNDTMSQLEKLRAPRRPRVAVTYVPTEYTSTNGKKWHCEHTTTAVHDVIIQPDDSEAVLICEDCGAQLINNEWAEGSV